jgi:hypothetical protein
MLVLTLSNTLNAPTVTASSVTLFGPTGALPTTLSVSGSQINVAPTTKLLPLTTYSLTITTAVRGSLGEQPPANITTNFTTRDQWLDPTLVETENLGSADQPALVIDGSGNAIAVWAQSDGVRTNAWSNRFTVTNGWGTAELLENNDVESVDNVHLAIDGSGNAMAVWTQANPIGSRTDVWARRYVIGAGWGTAQVIEVNDAGSAYQAQVAMDFNGNAIAVWWQYDGTNYNIYANRFTVAGGWGSPVLLENNNGWAYAPKIGIDGLGNAVVVWYQANSTTLNIWSSRYVVAASNWTVAQQIESSAADSRDVALAVSANGVAVTTWREFNGLTDAIWASRWMPASGWDGPQAIDTFGRSMEPQVAADENGNFAVVWTQTDGTRYNVAANRCSITTGWGTSVLLESDAGTAIGARIAADPSGNLLATWGQSDGTRMNLLSSYLTQAGGWGAPKRVESSDGTVLVSSAAFAPVRSALVFDRSGNALSLWIQSDGTRNNLWANRFEP